MEVIDHELALPRMDHVETWHEASGSLSIASVKFQRELQAIGGEGGVLVLH